MNQFVPVGIMGCLLAGLLAAFLGTFAGTLNAAQAYIMNDFYIKYLRPRAGHNDAAAIGHHRRQSGLRRQRRRSFAVHREHRASDPTTCRPNPQRPPARAVVVQQFEPALSRRREPAEGMKTRPGTFPGSANWEANCSNR
jgi:hypothetical protein